MVESTRWVWHVEECRCTRVWCIPPVQAFAGQEQYYVRSSSHSEECIGAINNALDRQIYPQLQASGGQEQYYVRSSWHLHCTDKSYIAIGNLTYSNLSNLCRLICVLLLDRKQRAETPPETYIMDHQQANDTNHLCSPI